MGSRLELHLRCGTAKGMGEKEGSEYDGREADIRTMDLPACLGFLNFVWKRLRESACILEATSSLQEGLLEDSTNGFDFPAPEVIQSTDVGLLAVFQEHIYT